MTADLEHKPTSRDYREQQAMDLELAERQVAALTAKMDTAPASELKDLVLALSRATYWRRTLLKWMGKEEPTAKDEPGAAPALDMEAARATAAKLRSAA